MKNLVLNPYKIVWAIEVKANGTFKMDHYPNLEKLQQNHKGTIGSKVYVITDKQFGMIQNSFDGTTPKLQKPFTHSILLEAKGVKSLVSITKKQFENPILF